MDYLKAYLFFNCKYNNLNRNQLLLQYKADLRDTTILKSFKDFKIKYPYFDSHFYKNAYEELKDKNDKELIIHWINYGVYNNYISNKKDFYKKYNNFDYKLYKNINKIDLDDEDKIIFYFLLKGKYIDNNKSEEIVYKNELIAINQKKESVKKIGHLFVHFFKCGGGEIFIQNFLKYSSCKNYLLLNKNYESIVSKNLKIDIIYYQDKNDLLKLLNRFDIIFDHQYYLFEELENNINVIQIIHSVNKYYDVVNYDYNLTINLYQEKDMNLSWNNIIKVINYLGVNECKDYETIMDRNINNIKNKKCIVKNIAIVGRIDEHKCPVSFLEILIKFSKSNSYIFNIYGNIDNNYKKYFLKSIVNKKNIFYHDYIEYENMSDVYLKNDIILSPSKSEAGATVLLEGMNYGLIPICRNKGGNSETINNNKYLVNEDNEYFYLLNKIKEIKYDTLYKDIFNFKKKILLKHNNKNNYTKLIQIADNYYNTVIEKGIPNIVHYIYGFKEQNEPFPFLYYYGILSNILMNKPLKIYFHYQYEPYGIWWNKIKKYVILNYINYNNLSFNNKEVYHYAHKSDYLRLLLLYKYGGIYYDIDTLCVKSHNELLDNNLVLGIQERFKDEMDLLGNAIMMSKKGNSFIKLIIDNYESHFDNNKWTDASLFLPSKLYKNLCNEEKKKIKLLSNKYFYYPNYNEEYLLFNNENEMDNDLVTYHYCYNYTKFYIENIKNIDYIFNNNNLFSKMMEKIYIKYLQNVFEEKEDCENTKIILNEKEIQDLIIIIEDNNIDILKRISNIVDIFYYNIHIFIYSHKNLEEDLQNTIDLIQYYKNINIYYVELYEKINTELKVKLSKYLVNNFLINKNIKILLLYNNFENCNYIDEIIQTPNILFNVNDLMLKNNVYVNPNFNIDLLELNQIFKIKNIYY